MRIFVGDEAMRRGVRWLWLLAAVPLTCGSDASGNGLVDPSGRYAIQQWTVGDGLPDVPLTGVAVAADGRVVVASRSTLTRFDGINLEPLPTPLVKPLHDRIGTFWSIGFDPAGRLWVQGGRAIARLADELAADLAGWRVYQLRGGSITSLAFTPDGRPLVVGPDLVAVLDGAVLEPLEIVSETPVTWTYGGIDAKAGTLWLWGADSGKRTLVSGLLPAGGGTAVSVMAADSTIATEVISMAFGNHGPVALLQDAAAVFRDGRWRRATPTLPDPEHRTSGKIAAAGDGTLWMSDHTGLLAARDGLLDAPTARLPAFSYFTRGLVADPTGGVWAACKGGLVAVRRTRVELERIAESQAVLERADGSLLVGTPGGIWEVPSAARPDGGGPARTFASLPDGAVPTALVEDARGRVWVGTRDNFLLRLDGAAVEQVTGPDAYDRELRSVQSLAIAADGRVWAATGNGLAVLKDADSDAFAFIPGASGRDAPSVIGLAADGDDGVLVASASHGVVRVSDAAANQPLLAAADLPGRSGVVLYRDTEGTLWAGGERGLVRVTGDAALFRITPARGLIDDAIVQIAEDRAGRLWVAGRTGSLQGIRLADLSALAAGRLAVVRGVVLGPLDGLGGLACIGRLARTATTPGRQLVVPLDGGVVRFVPETVALSAGPLRPPLVRRADGMPLAFAFSAAGLAWGERPLFQTLLAGVDRDWSAPSAATRREYPTVPPGDHEFRVRLVAGESDQEFPVSRLAVSVGAPWWRSPAAAAGLAGLAAIAGWGLSRGPARRRIADLERQRELDRERARIARDIHDSLGAGLTRVALLSDLARRSDRPADVRQRLDAIHHDARDLTRSVDEIVWAVNPGNDTLARFVSYVVHDVEQFARAGELSLRLDVPDTLDDDLPLPAGVRHHVCLAVRELLQNVLRHARASHLDFRIAVDGPRLTVTVADDGIGCSGLGDVAAGQDGLANVRARAAEAGGEVMIQAAARAGTQVMIRVPLAGAAVTGMANGSGMHGT
jgi:signal transduction histidine kinase/streptogramin lyase